MIGQVGNNSALLGKLGNGARVALLHGCRVAAVAVQQGDILAAITSGWLTASLIASSLKIV